jgi:hypothetical protein
LQANSPVNRTACNHSSISLKLRQAQLAVLFCILVQPGYFYGKLAVTFVSWMYFMENLTLIGRWLVAAGIALVIVGGILWLLGRIPGLSQLPGTLRLQGQNITCVFPVLACILLSILLTVVLNVVARLLNR